MGRGRQGQTSCRSRRNPCSLFLGLGVCNHLADLLSAGEKSIVQLQGRTQFFNRDNTRLNASPEPAPTRCIFSSVLDTSAPRALRPPSSQRRLQVATMQSPPPLQTPSRARDRAIKINDVA